jgi:hypothetical protein
MVIVLLEPGGPNGGLSVILDGAEKLYEAGDCGGLAAGTISLSSRTTR